MKHLADADMSSLELDELLALASDAPAALPQAGAAPVRPRIAIIGLAGCIGGCDDLDAFWELLRTGGSTRRAMPLARQADLREFLRLKGVPRPGQALEVFRESFLTEIDKFDHAFFGIARQEANLMDPNQRLFLQTAWSALEHAGYGGASVQGSATGVFVGHSADFGDAYRDIVRTLAPDAPEVSVVGNVKSIVASRLAYHLDLRGPAMMVDTACSSGLVALHLACRALSAGDCEMAVAGAVKIDLVPVPDDPQTGTGVKDIHATMAADGLTRSFDDSGEGTSAAEGVLAFVLKPLERALADGDTLYGVVLGSAVNQDGLSVGITAPNMAAQEMLIARALQEAEVAPDTISCIEAHGTATKLGDPIEIAAIARAYGRYTRRRQYCAIGSVKTNVGHLDSAAGLGGLAKVLLALRHRQIPASLNMRRPNRKIAFENAPVYVNDRLQPWQPPAGVPRRAGINSFGLSGTNCHVIVEEPPQAPPVMAEASTPQLLLLSAVTPAALERLISAWCDFLDQFDGRVRDLCYTAAVGRLHYPCRLAIRFEQLDELRCRLAAAAAQGPALADEHVLWGQPPRGGALGGGAAAPEAQDIEPRLRALDEQAAADTGPSHKPATFWREAAQLYVRGADLPWDACYPPGSARRIPLPTYPFARTRCWVVTTESGERLARRGAAKQISHPLLDRCVLVSRGLRVYEATLSVDIHWELAEHKVRGHFVLPGTGFIEMMLEVAAQMREGAAAQVQLEQLVFLRPLALAAHQYATVHITLAAGEDGKSWQVRAVSQIEGHDDWNLHAEALLRSAAAAGPVRQDLAALRALRTEAVSYSLQEDASRGLEIGDRWNRSVHQAWASTTHDALLVHLRLPERYAGEAQRYHCHPALLDTAVNAANHLSGGGALYLPFAYKRLDVFRSLPPDFYASLHRKPDASAEICRFDIELIAADGTVCVRASDYAVKRVGEDALAWGETARAHALSLVPAPAAAAAAHVSINAPVLVLGPDTPAVAALAAAMRAAGAQVHEVVRTPAAEPSLLLAPFDSARLGGVIYLTASAPAAVTAELHALADFVRAIAARRLRMQGGLLLLTRGAFAVPGQALPVEPGAAALAALARIARLEYPQQRWRVVDSDAAPEAAALLQELATVEALAQGDLSVWRGGVRHRERLETLAPLLEARFEPRAGGIYIITGGLGALGLELAGRLVARGPVTLALVSSTPLPPQAQWEALAADAATPAKLRHALRRLHALQAQGAQLLYRAADVADAAQMTALLDELRREHGAIHGVVHAAGRAGTGFLHGKSRETAERVVAPKIEGARLLHELTLNDPLQFFVMYSSVATVLRSAGQSDYTAGNAYLDALAWRRRQLGLPAVSVCWPAWREVGIAVEYGAVDEQEFFVPIAPADALPLIERVLCDAGQLPPVVVLSALNEHGGLQAVEALGIELPEVTHARLRRSQRTGAAARSAEAEVVLKGIGASDDIVRTVAGAWSRILGLTEFHADDAFADHGGNSILTTQLHGEYEKLYPGVMDIVDLFTCTTVREQSDFIRKALGRAAPAADGAGGQEDELAAVLVRLSEGSISPEEAQSLLAS
ncbi:MAG: SDR family NAD(P)-dependent oxidoreductase [Betaproteobacteria bacterium]